RDVSRNSLATKRTKTQKIKPETFCAFCAFLWLRFDRHHHYAVTRHFGGKFFGEIAEVLVSPEVAHLRRQVRRVADVGPGHRDVCRLCTTIEEHHRASAISQLFVPDFQ